MNAPAKCQEIFMLVARDIFVVLFTTLPSAFPAPPFQRKPTFSFKCTKPTRLCTHAFSRRIPAIVTEYISENVHFANVTKPF